MRQDNQSARGRALCWTLTVGCATGLSLSGCINNPTLGVANSVSREAAAAALAAEAESTRKKLDVVHAELDEQPPVAKARTKAEPEVQLAGGEQPFRSLLGLRSAARKEQEQPSAAVSDPFVELEKSVAATERRSAAPAAAPAPIAKPRTAPKPVDQKLAQSPPPKSATGPGFDVEAWLKKELPSSRHAPAAVVQKDEPAPAVSPEAPEWAFAASPREESVAKSSPPATPPAVARFQPAAFAPAAAPQDKPVLNEANPFAGDVKTAANDVQPAAAADNPFAKFVNRAADHKIVQQPPQAQDGWSPVPPKSESPAALPQPESLARKHPLDDEGSQPEKQPEPRALSAADEANVKHAQLRVRALLSDSRSAEIRGELKEAYRSATIAANLANEHALTFAAVGDDPRPLAQDLGRRIYRLENPEPKHDASRVETAVAVEETPKAPVLGSLNFQQVAQVQPAPRLEAAEPPRPLIRPASPANSRRIGVWLTQPEFEQAAAKQPALQPVAQLPPASREPQPLNSGVQPLNPQAAVESPWKLDGRIDAEPGVEHAIAQSVVPSAPVQNDAWAQAGVVPSASARKPLVPPSDFAPVVADAAGELRAPLLPPRRLEVPASEPSSLVTWEQVAQPDLVSQRDRIQDRPAKSGSRRWMWGLAGLIAATVSTIVGIRLTRREEDDTPADDAVPASVPFTVVSDEERHTAPPLKIKRAA